MKAVRQLQGMALASPLLIRDDKVLFLQQDCSATLLKLDTGEVVSRQELPKKFPKMKNWGLYYEKVEEWQVRGRAAIGTHNSRIYIVDLETGTLTAPISDSIRSPYHMFYENNLFYIDGDDFIRLDCETMEKVTLRQTKIDDFDILDGVAIVFSNRFGYPQLSRLEGLDSRTGTVLWSHERNKGDEWHGFACLDGRIHVFAKKKKTLRKKDNKNTRGDKQAKPLNAILVFDSKGNQLATEKPVIADFAGAWPTTFNSYIFRGVEFRGMRPASSIQSNKRLSVEEKEQQRNSRLRKSVGYPSLTDEQRKTTLNSLIQWDVADAWIPIGEYGMAGISYLRRGSYQTQDAYGIFHIDDTLDIWKGRIASMDDMTEGKDLVTRIPGLFSMAATDKYLVFSTPNGKVECLDRKTGRSLWIYSYPAFDFVQWDKGSFTRFFSGDTNYLQQRALYEKGLSPAEQRGVVVSGEADWPPPNVIIDPLPHPFPKSYLAPIFSWGSLLFLLWLLLKNSPAKGIQRLQSAKSGAGWAIIVSFVVVIVVVRYSPPLATAIDILAYIAVVWWFLRRSALKRLSAQASPAGEADSSPLSQPPDQGSAG